VEALPDSSPDSVIQPLQTYISTGYTGMLSIEIIPYIPAHRSQA